MAEAPAPAPTTKVRLTCSSCRTLCEVLIPALPASPKPVRYQVRCPNCKSINDPSSASKPPAADPPQEAAKRRVRLLPPHPAQALEPEPHTLWPKETEGPRDRAPGRFAQGPDALLPPAKRSNSEVSASAQYSAAAGRRTHLACTSCCAAGGLPGGADLGAA